MKIITFIFSIIIITLALLLNVLFGGYNYLEPTPVTGLNTKTEKIAIVGGGPGGVSAAWFLQKNGYNDITLFEQNNEIGGKCLTLNITENDVTRNYELGAEFVPYHYFNVHGLCKELGLEKMEAPKLTIIGENGRFTDTVNFNLTVGLAIFRYLWEASKYKKYLNSPGNIGIANNKELLMSAADFIKKHKLDTLKGIFVIRQFGYGDFEKFPAIHLLKTIHPLVMGRIILDKIPFINNFIERPIASIILKGTQGLFKEVAKRLEESKAKIYTNHKLFKVEKKGSKIELEFKTKENVEKKVYDRVIFAIPLPEMSLINGIDEKQKTLFEKFTYHPYWVGALKTKKILPRYYFQNLNFSKLEPVQLNKRWNEGSILVRGYIKNAAKMETDKKEKEKVDKEFMNFMKKRMGVEETTLLKESRYWPTYHPHVQLKDFEDGIYDKIDELQSKNGMYYVGDSLCFESMEMTVTFSKFLVHKYFQK